MNIRRVVVLLIAVLAAGFLATGCGGGGTGSASISQPTASISRPTRSADAPVASDAPVATAGANAVSAVDPTTAAPKMAMMPNVRAYRSQMFGQRTKGMFHTVFIAFCIANPIPRLP